MLNTKNELEILWHEVFIPLWKIVNWNWEEITAEEYYTIRKDTGNCEDWVWDSKKNAILTHFDKISNSDSIIVLNYEKNNINWYIWANTLLEMWLALYLKKKIFLLNDIPELSYKEEILWMKPIILNWDLLKIKKESL